MKFQDDNVEGQEAEEESKTEDPSLREFTLTLSRCIEPLSLSITLSGCEPLSLSLFTFTLSFCFDHHHFQLKTHSKSPFQALISPESDAVRR